MSAREMEEREASEFARELLMPEEEFKAAVARERTGGDLTDAVLHRVANEFAVPVEQALIRMLTLKLIKRHP